MYSDSEEVCPNCGSDNLEATGRFYTTQTQKYATFRCGDCGKISRSRASTTVESPKRRGYIPA
jgi:predicted RNA-binding Zn-ribbon protein involved in translation (DUF1610 family)